jgi:RNA polymerase sigma-70 factor (ECF subfamily)
MTAQQHVVGGPPSSLSHRLQLRQEQKLLLEALRGLTLELQMVVQLHYWERLPLAEIGTIMEIPVGTVKSRLARAREGLRRNIAAAEASEALKQSTATDLERWAHSLRAQILAECTSDVDPEKNDVDG